jgi:NTE family protein
MPDAPVEAIVTDDPNRKPENGTALCLSGGGYRAMLFHLGALWRLYELGLLRTIKRISSVSGGSITAGVLGLNWSKLSFDPAKI